MDQRPTNRCSGRAASGAPLNGTLSVSFGDDRPAA